MSELVKNGNTNHTETSSYLKTLISDNQESSPAKSTSNEKPNNNHLLIGGLILFGISLLAIGYLLGKRKKHQDQISF